jgi:hypothetical protein
VVADAIRVDGGVGGEAFLEDAFDERDHAIGRGRWISPRAGCSRPRCGP